jgi:serine phosphatase RsbU (regulator of sigma subunit)
LLPIIVSAAVYFDDPTPSHGHLALEQFTLRMFATPCHDVEALTSRASKQKRTLAIIGILMQAHLVPPNEHERLSALYRYKVLDSRAEEAYDRIVGLAAHIFRVPVVLINLVDRERQWTKSRYGTGMREIDRQISFCTYTILSNEVTVIPDARLDPRFRHLPLVTAEGGLRFYAGAPLTTPDNFNIGSLCILDTVPRHSFTDHEQELLQDLAYLVVDELELRLALEVAREKNAQRHELEEQLTGAQQRLLNSNAELRRAQQQLHRELEHAARIQTNLLPHDPPKLPGFEMAAGIRSAREVGGDFYDWQLSSPTCATFTLGDISGKGLPASLLMTTVLATMRAVVRDSPPLEALEYVSRVLEPELASVERFITLFLGQIDAATRELHYVDAGHGLVFMRRSDGTVEPLGERSLPLGVLSEVPRCEGRTRFCQGDTLVVFSDGLLCNHPEFSSETAIIADQIKGAESAEEMVERLMALGKESGVLEDDLTVLVLHCRRPF